MYLGKVEKSWWPQFLCPLLSTRVYVLVLNDGLHYFDSVVLVSKKTIVCFLDDKAGRRYQAFARPMLGRWRLLREPFPRSYGHLFGWAVVLPINFPFWHPFADGLKGWRGYPLLSLSLFFLACCSSPYLRSQPSCLHFYRKQISIIKASWQENLKC